MVLTAEARYLLDLVKLQEGNMNTYDKMMDAVWNLCAMVGEVQTSNILCNDILKAKESYRANLLDPKLDEGARAFWMDALSNVQAELSAYEAQLSKLHIFLDELERDVQK